MCQISEAIKLHDDHFNDYFECCNFPRLDCSYISHLVTFFKSFFTVASMNAIQPDRESRVLASMSCYEEAWKRYVDRISEKLGRAPGQSLLTHSDQFKEKKYVADFLTKMRPLSEVLSDSIWYKSLRTALRGALLQQRSLKWMLEG